MNKHKVLSILLSLLLSIGVWMYVVTAVTPEDTQWVYRIPVTFINEDGLFSDRNLTLTQGRDAAVNLQFRGNRQELTRLNNTNVTITVDLSQVTAPGEWHLGYEFSLPETVSRSNISVESRSSSTIDVLVERLAASEVEVRAVFQGDVAEGYVPEPIKLEYDTIEISGPKDLVDEVAYAQVVLERTNVTTTISDNLSFTLMDAEDQPIESEELRCGVEKIGVEMPVYMVKEVPLTVLLSEGGGATEEHADVKIEPETVTIKGDPADLEGLNSISVGRIDLSSIQKSAKKVFTIIIPDGMENLTGESATVTVELVNLKTKTFQVTNIEYVNAPSSDYRVILGTTSLQVQVRGATDTINSMEASSIRAVADLSSLGASTGQYLVPVEIYVDGYSDVGAMGTYSVLVTISEAVDEENVIEVTEGPAVTDTIAETESPEETG